MKLNLRGIIEDTDRHGNVRIYFRVKGKKKVRLREKPGTAAFLREHECAEKGIPYSDAPVIADSAKPVVARSFRLLGQQYFKRAANSVTVDTMSRRRRLLEDICIKHGDKPFELLERKHVTAVRDTRIDSPGAANNIVKAISALYAWAIEVGEAKVNPKRHQAAQIGRGVAYLVAGRNRAIRSQASARFHGSSSAGDLHVHWPSLVGRSDPRAPAS